MKGIGGVGMLVGSLIAAMAISGCDVGFVVEGKHIKGTGAVKSETRSLGSFQRVQVGGGFTVDVKIGSHQSVTVEAQQNLLPHIKTKIKGETLSIGSEDSISTDKPLLVHIVVPNLDGFDISGGAEGRLDGLHGKRFSTDVSGGARLKLNGTADDFSIEATGGAEAVLDGLNALTFKATASGGSSILVKGRTSKARIEATGAGTLKGEAFNITDADVNASGASNVSIHVTGQLNAEATGATTIRYSGSAKAHARASGASSIDHTE
jgi:hypothetical protein